MGLSSSLWIGPILGGAYVRREICVSKSIGLPCSGKEIYYFCFVLLCIWGQIPSTSPPGAYIRRGDLTEGFLMLPFWGAYIWRNLYMEGLIFGILRYNLWIILKEHNNFSYLWKFGPKYSSFAEILFKKSHWFTFLPPSNFKLDYLYSICNWMQRAENNFLVQIPKIMQFIWLSNFNLYIRRHLLWDNWHGNEQKCKQRHQQRFAYRAPACCSGGRCFESFRELKDIFLLSNL